MDTDIRVSTESRPWRRKFSHHSCRDLNPGPFSHESGALTTELSPSPSKVVVFVCFIACGMSCGLCVFYGLWEELSLCVSCLW